MERWGRIKVGEKHNNKRCEEPVIERCHSPVVSRALDKREYLAIIRDNFY